MSPVNPPRRIATRQHDELRKDTVVTLYAKALDLFENNRQVLYGVLAGLVVLALLIVGWVLYRQNQEAEAQNLLANAVTVYEAGNYREALDGTPERLGLLAIADEYGSTDAGNLAHFYAGDALYNLGEYEAAAEHFEDYDEEESLIGASALAGVADAYLNMGNPAEAAEYYRQAALLYEEEATAPHYLKLAGRAYEEAGDFEAARAMYEMIRDDYPDTPQAGEVDVLIARVDARQAAQS